MEVLFGRNKVGEDALARRICEEGRQSSESSPECPQQLRRLDGSRAFRGGLRIPWVQVSGLARVTGRKLLWSAGSEPQTLLITTSITAVFIIQENLLTHSSASVRAGDSIRF